MDIQVDETENMITLIANGVINEQILFSYAVNRQLITESNCVFKFRQMTLKIVVSDDKVQFSCL